MVVIVVFSLFLAGCTDKEFVDSMCKNKKDLNDELVCLLLVSGASGDSGNSGCQLNSDCLGACDGTNVMDGKCKSGKCTLEYAYSCQENGIDAKCVMQANKPSCTQPHGQCSIDSQCPGTCSGTSVMDGKCVNNRCEQRYAYSCQENGVDATCLMKNGKPECTQPKDQCSDDSQCQDACQDDSVMKSSCVDGRCILSEAVSCTSINAASTCVFKDGKPACTQVASQCTVDSDCPDACQDQDVLDGVCIAGICKLEYGYSCQEFGKFAQCKIENGKPACAS